MPLTRKNTIIWVDKTGVAHQSNEIILNKSKLCLDLKFAIKRKSLFNFNIFDEFN